MAKLPDAYSVPVSTPQPAAGIPSYQGGIAEAGGAAMGEGFAKLGSDVRAAADQFQDRANEMWARDKSTALMLDMNKAYSDFRRLEGKDAVAAYDAHEKALVQMRQAALANAPNAAAGKMLGDHSNTIMTRMILGARTYADEQFKVGEERSLKAATEGLIQTATTNQNDPVLLAQSADAVRLNSIRLAEHRGLHGAEAEAVAAADVGRFYRTVIGDMVNNPGGIDRAAALFGQVKGRMDGPSQVAIGNLLRPKMIQSQGDATADAVWTGSAETDTRADKVRDGLIKRGWSPAAAIGLAANAVQESGARADAPVGDGGISHGVFQWNGDRLARFKAKYGKLPGEATLDEQLDFANEELNTTERASGAALRAAKTPEEAAKIASTQYLRPRDTAAEETRRSAIASRLGRRAYAAPGSATDAPEAAPDMERMTRAILDKHLDPDVEAAALSALNRRHSIWQLNTSTERDTIAKQFADMKAALLAGKSDVDIPEDRIRAVFPPAKANDMIGELNVARGAGQIMQGVNLGTPAEIAAALEDLAAGTGYLSAMLRARGKKTTGGAAGTEDKDTPEQFVLRQKVLGEFNKLVEQRQKVLDQDAAAYAMQAPTVQAAVTAAQASPNDPKAQQAVIDASLAAQAHLGVPEDKRRALSNAQVADLVGTIKRLDPEKSDLGMELDKLLRGYGPHAERAFGELVQHGKLPGEYMVLATMTDPAQVSARQDMQRALAMVSQPGGMDKLKTAAGQANVTAIEKALPGALEAFRNTTKWNEGGPQLYATVEHAAKLLALRYAFQGKDPATATEDAVKALTTAKYDFRDTIRAPKGMMDQVQASADFVRSGIKPEDLAPALGNPRLTQEERQQELARGVRDGSWVPNRDDTGLTLMLKLSDGMRVAKRKDGTPIEIKFDNLPAATPDAVAAARAARQTGFMNRPEPTRGTGRVGLPAFGRRAGADDLPQAASE